MNDNRSTTTKTVHSRDEYESEQVDEYMINQDQLIHYHPSRVALYVFCVGVDDASSENHTFVPERRFRISELYFCCRQFISLLGLYFVLVSHHRHFKKVSK
jgi:hypothetical protein